MGETKGLNNDFEKEGFAIVPDVIGAEERVELVTALGAISGAGRRGLLGLPSITKLARSAKLLALARQHLASKPFPVRAIYFHKSAEANWLVPWHQDLTLALRARAELPGFGPWSKKDNIPHVQPPVELLQQMLTIRLHLDDADQSNGALRVLPGSHRFGRLAPEQIQALRRNTPEFVCVAAAGSALLMRPLLLHASGRANTARSRRILHIEYAAFALPSELQWHEAA